MTEKNELIKKVESLQQTVEELERMNKLLRRCLNDALDLRKNSSNDPGPRLNFYDYQQSIEISSKGYWFYALLASLMRKADSSNLEKLKSAYPKFYEDLVERYNAPGGALEGEEYLLKTMIGEK